MKPIKVASSNHNFGPPPNVADGSIGDLPCEIVGYDDGCYVYSVWQPSEAERKAIANGQNVRLGVGWIGGFPPVSLGVTHEGATAPAETPDPTHRSSLRSRLYGRARVNGWPLWIACLLASGSSRQTVRELRELRKAGVDV